MPYIGSDPSNRFVAPKAATQFSGDGSTTAFTLDHAVGSDEDILVSVDGVIQEPSVAYAVSNGTTLTFTAAPSSNSGNNIFVYYLFRTVGTVSHPSNNALSATSGTFTGDVTIGDASAADKKILFDGNAQDFHIGLDDSADSLTIGLGSALGTTPYMVLDANGHVTKPSQCGFLVHRNSSLDNFAKDTNHTQSFVTEVFDTNGDFSSDTFTAPVDGFYFLHASMRLADVDTGATFYVLQIATSGRTNADIMRPAFSSDGDYHQLRVVVYQQMDAGDTAVVKIQQSGGTNNQTDVNNSSAYTFFNGYLVN
tara:strand:+ start:73 stop:999 length:927 start_codon:yes stop_codon:yes gene_type:complete